MSVTTFLRNRDVRDTLSSFCRYPKPWFKLPPEEIKCFAIYPTSNGASEVGMAFDYLLRFHLEELNDGRVSRGHLGLLYDYEWVAELGLDRLRGMKVGRGSRIRQQGREILEEAKELRDRLLREGRWTNWREDLAVKALGLARLEGIARSSILPRDQNLLRGTDSRHIRDLGELLTEAEALGSSFKARNYCILNPKFGEASRMILGGDADFLIDGLLVDIKTTLNCQMKKYYLDQLVMYYILSRIGGIFPASITKHTFELTQESHTVPIPNTGEEYHRVPICPPPEISTIGVYFSRYGRLVTYLISDVLDLGRLSEILVWFETRAARFVRETLPAEEYSRFRESTEEKGAGVLGYE